MGGRLTEMKRFCVSLCEEPWVVWLVIQLCTILQEPFVYIICCIDKSEPHMLHTGSSALLASMYKFTQTDKNKWETELMFRAIQVLMVLCISYISNISRFESTFAPLVRSS